MDYVNEETHQAVVEMERKFQALSPQAGVMFVSVEPLPAPDGWSTRFKVALGMNRRFEKATGIALATSVLTKEISRGLTFTIVVYRGVRGSSRDEGSPAARPPPA